MAKFIYFVVEAAFVLGAIYLLADVAWRKIQQRKNIPNMLRKSLFETLKCKWENRKK